MGACPPLEEIAAFLDGMLSPEDRERITAHLASCESCYEVFAGAAQFQEYERSEADTGEVVVQGPFGGETDRAGVSLPPTPELGKVRPRGPQWFALAASILLATALGFFAWRAFLSPPEMVFAGLLKQVEEANTPTQFYKRETLRSLDDPEYLFPDRPIFMTGVHLFDLRLSLQMAGGAETTERLLQDLDKMLKEIPVEVDFSGLYQQGNVDRDVLLEKEAEIQDAVSGSIYFQFGLWTEAGRLAALTHSSEFFETRNNRRFLDYLFKETPWEGDESLEGVPTDLEAIQQIWERKDLTPEDYVDLERHFHSIIKAYDTSDEP